LFAVVLGAVALMSLPLLGHQDPPGDLHPIVRVENGNFAIYFRNNTLGDEAPNVGERPQFRVVHSATGELLAPRHRAPSQVEEERRSPGTYGAVLSVGDERLTFTQDLLHERPSYLRTIDGRTERRRLAWPGDLKLNYVHDVIAEERSLVFAATLGRATLRLFHFSRDTFDAPAIAELGEATTIYDFPGASNLVYAGGRYWIGWMRVDRVAEAVVTVLTSWKPGTNPVHTALNLPSDWNVNLSLAATNEHLCLAYHCGTGPRIPHATGIVTYFQKLPP